MAVLDTLERIRLREKEHVQDTRLIVRTALVGLALETLCDKYDLVHIAKHWVQDPEFGREAEFAITYGLEDFPLRTSTGVGLMETIVHAAGLDTSRLCYSCGIRKPLKAFNKRHDGLLGFDDYCKKCETKRVGKYPKKKIR